MRRMFDCLELPAPPPAGYDVAAGYVPSPGISRGWSSDTWARAATVARWLLPIVGYSWNHPPPEQAAGDVVNELGALLAALPHFPKGAAIALDVEANVAAGAGGYVNAWARAIVGAGYFPLVYTSKSAAGYVTGVPLWLAEWNNTPHLIADTMATQYSSPSTNPALRVDESLVADGLPLYDTRPEPGDDPMPHQFVAIVADPSHSAGYWVVADDGAVFSFGGAKYHGGANGKQLAAPIVAMTPTHDGGGYWLAGRDGGVFAFGNAKFGGSAVGK